MLHDAVRDRGVPVACIDHHVSAGHAAAGPALRGPAGERHRRAGLRAGRGQRLGHPAERGAGAVRRDPHRHRRLPLQQHRARGCCAWRPTCSRSASTRSRSTSRCTPTRRRAGTGSWPRRCRRWWWSRTSGWRGSPCRRARWSGYGVSADDLDGVVEYRALGGGRADGAALPRDRPGPGEGVAPVGGRRGRGGVRASRSAAAGTPRPPGCRSRARLAEVQAIVLGGGAGVPGDAASPRVDRDGAPAHVAE